MEHSFVVLTQKAPHIFNYNINGHSYLFLCKQDYGSHNSKLCMQVLLLSAYFQFRWILLCRQLNHKPICGTLHPRWIKVPFGIIIRRPHYAVESLCHNVCTFDMGDRTCWGRKFRHAKCRRSTKSFRVQVQWSYFNIISCLSRKQNCRYNYFRTWKCASYVQTWHSIDQTDLHELAAYWMCLYYKLVCSCGLHTCTCITGHTKYGSRKYPFRLRGRMLFE